MFYLKQPKAEDTTLIYLIYRVEGKNFKLSTREKINPKDWDFENKTPKRRKGNHTLTATSYVLRAIEEKVDRYINDCKITDVKPSYLGLKRALTQVEVKTYNDYVRSLLLTDIRDKKGKPMSKRTLQHYDTTLSYLDKFGVFAFNQVNLSFHKKFMLFMEQEHNLSINTIGGYVKNIKVFLRRAKKDGYTINEESLSSDFFIPEEKSESIFLTQSEITTLFNHDFEGRKKKVRDWAIIGCWTGLRVSDWISFNPKDEFIEIETQKTGKKVVIPLHHQVKQIIKNGVPGKCSDVEFNRVIKKVCEDAGITNKVYASRRSPETNRLEKGYLEKWKFVSSHTCRRSFATNNYLMGVDTLTIMAITGHTTEKNFLKYIKVTPREHAKRLLKKWNEYYQ